jgi:hypothetical protein
LLIYANNDLLRANADIANLVAELAATEGEVAACRAMLAAKRYAPATRRQYQEVIADHEEKIATLNEQIAALKAERSSIADVLADTKLALDNAVQAHNDAVAVIRALPAPITVQPWQELFGALAEPPVTLRGVSSGEGLIYAIRDARDGHGGAAQRSGRHGKAPARQFERVRFGIGVGQAARIDPLGDYPQHLDCVTIETGAKVSPVRCKEPYGSISASITPFELTGLLFDEKDLAASADNGFGNRFLYLYVARDKLVAIPAPTEGRNDLTRKVAENVKQVYAALKPRGAFLSTPIEFTPDAKAL